jgi:cytoskeletal protein RodZ
MTVVDNFGTPDAPSSQPVEAAVVPEKRPGFFSTTAGKLVIGAIAIVVVLIAIAVIGTFFLLGQSRESDSEAIVVETEAPSGTTGSAEASVAPRPVPAPEDIFTFRNVFEPTVKVTLTSSSSGSSDGGSVDVPDNTLYLAGVSTVDGQPVAELVWNGQTYTLSEGESIPNSPWKVLSIDTTNGTVVMLYGDSRVTLTVGQGISK